MVLENPADQFLAYVREQAMALASKHGLPSNRQQWGQQSKEIRERLVKALGGFPASKCKLKAQTLGKMSFDGYTIEKVVLQTIPGVWMTANIYRPDGDGPFPAVLCVHGHWKGAKQDPTVQARCIGLAC